MENDSEKGNESELDGQNKEDLSSLLQHKNYLLVLGIILTFSGIMRFKGLDTESFWLDELTTLHAISQGTWRLSLIHI